jgi:hypothetical protein
MHISFLDTLSCIVKFSRQGGQSGQSGQNVKINSGLGHLLTIIYKFYLYNIVADFDNAKPILTK